MVPPKKEFWSIEVLYCTVELWSIEVLYCTVGLERIGKYWCPLNRTPKAETRTVYLVSKKQTTTALIILTSIMLTACSNVAHLQFRKQAALKRVRNDSPFGIAAHHHAHIAPVPSWHLTSTRRKGSRYIRLRVQARLSPAGNSPLAIHARSESA